MLCHEFGSDGEAVGEAAFDDGDGLISAVSGGLLAGVFGDVDECRGTGCGLSGIFLNYLRISMIVRLIVANNNFTLKVTRKLQKCVQQFHFSFNETLMKTFGISMRF